MPRGRAAGNDLALHSVLPMKSRRSNMLSSGVRLVGRALAFTCAVVVAYFLVFGFAIWRHEASSAAYWQRETQRPVPAHLEVPFALRWLTPRLGEDDEEVGMGSSTRHLRYPLWYVGNTGDWRQDLPYEGAVFTITTFTIMMAIASTVTFTAVQRLPLTWGCPRFRQLPAHDLHAANKRWRVVRRVDRSSWSLLVSGGVVVGLSTAMIGDAVVILLGRLLQAASWREGIIPSHYLKYFREFDFGTGTPHPLAPLALLDAVYLFALLLIVVTAVVILPARRKFLRREAFTRCVHCMYPRPTRDRTTPCPECGRSSRNTRGRLTPQMHVSLFLAVVLVVSLSAFALAPLLVI